MNQEILSPDAVPEHWLHWTFLSPDLLKKPLRTLDGKRIAIVDPGRLNYDNGPDVLNALLVIDGIRQRGDVEFHLTPRDWFRHGHHDDRRYRNVILHVVWEVSHGVDPSIQRRFPHLILRDHIAAPLSRWREKMRLLENESDPSQSMPGAAALTPSLLMRYGQRRFQRKVERFKYWLQQFSFEDVVMISLAEALGYSKNKFPFRQLLWENPPSHIFGMVSRLSCSPIEIWTFLAIRANFLTTRSFLPVGSGERQPGSVIREEIHRLFLYFTGNGVLPVLQLADWYFARLRPPNNPIIRLAGLAQILFHYRSRPLFRVMLHLASERLNLTDLLSQWQATLRLPLDVRLRAALETVLHVTVPHHLALGDTRIKQFLVNAVLPLMYIWAERSGNQGFQQYLEGIYEGFPGCEDTRLIERLGAADPSLRSNFRKRAVYQQGLLEYVSQMQAREGQLFSSSSECS